MNPCKMYSLYNCILIGAAVLSIYSAESASDEPITSQKYNQRDVSVTYSISKHKNESKILPQKMSQLANNQNIQYAPLVLKTKERQYNQDSTSGKEVNKQEDYTETNTVTDFENNDETNSLQEQKINIIPNIDSSESSNDRSWKYVPGYNVDLKAVKNKLMQSGLYASNPNLLVKNKQVNVNYLQPQVNNQKVKEVSLKNEAKGINLVFTYQHPKVEKQYNVNAQPKDKKSDKRPFFYVKASKVELNLARAHNIARSVPKASVKVNSSFKKLPTLPQEFFSNPQIIQPSKTLLYPIQNSKQFMIGRTP